MISGRKITCWYTDVCITRDQILDDRFVWS